MNRRKFLKSAGLGAAASSTLATPAIAQSQPQVRWRMASSFPQSLKILYQGAERMAQRVSEATDGNFDIRVFAAGELVPAFEVLDAVSNDTVECGHSASYYYVGKNLAFGFDCAAPFGLTTRQQNAWMYEGGGIELVREVLFDDYNIINLPLGNTGAQMGGWFRNEVNSVEDLEGLKMRISGFAGAVLEKLGVVPQQIPGGDIYPALERGTIDASELVGPYDDESVGLYEVAEYYYYPGWWEAGPQTTLYINRDAWNELTPEYQAILQGAAAEANVKITARYDAENPPALRRLVSKGTQLRGFNREILMACYKATEELYEEQMETNDKFRAIYEEWRKFRDEQYLWFRVAESSFDNFAFTAQARLEQEEGN
ncbi:TRAP transporter substrate-binding protein [Fodinicurvata sediminis]|uniref:TRAP transporter substrate-binding protein n=1 Tax=Fodinicurvata sediminis TaxID=1121832 RepID=UPI0003B7BA0B|nr:TRAP transporter substrate-binding protein [Fodinicurvata sediminis]